MENHSKIIIRGIICHRKTRFKKSINEPCAWDYRFLNKIYKSVLRKNTLKAGLHSLGADCILCSDGPLVLCTSAYTTHYYKQ